MGEHFDSVVGHIEKAIFNEMSRSYGHGHEPIQEGSPLLKEMARAAALTALNYRDYLW
jgi:hypothetical protein